MKAREAKALCCRDVRVVAVDKDGIRSRVNENGIDELSTGYGWRPAGAAFHTDGEPYAVLVPEEEPKPESIAGALARAAELWRDAFPWHGIAATPVPQANEPIPDPLKAPVTEGRARAIAVAAVQQMHAMVLKACEDRLLELVRPMVERAANEAAEGPAPKQLPHEWVYQPDGWHKCPHCKAHTSKPERGVAEVCRERNAKGEQFAG